MCKLSFIKMTLNYYLYIIPVYVYFKAKKNGRSQNYIVMNYNRSLILSLDKNLIIVNGPTREQTLMDLELGFTSLSQRIWKITILRWLFGKEGGQIVAKAVNKNFILSDVSTARDKKVINDVLTKISTVR